MLAIQRYLRDGNTLESLKHAYGVTHRRHRAHPNLVGLKYDMIESPMAEPLVRECRGLVLDEDNSWRVVGRGFDKFFNHGEGHAAEIHWPSARVQEKLDGSLVMLYHHADRWHCATTGTPDAGGNVFGSTGTFADLFWKTAGDRLSPFDIEAPEDLCFLFELCTPLNRIVVVHPEPKIVLLAVRNRETGTWEDDAIGYWGAALGVETVRTFPLGSVEEIAASFDAISPLSQEGYVVVDGHGQRVKIKHPGYVALHHAKDGLSTKSFVEIARTGETSEVLVAFPEFAPLLSDAKARVDALVAELEADYARIAHIPEQKAFALEAVKSRCSAALFSVRSKKADSVRSFLRGVPIDRLVDWLGYRDTPVAIDTAAE